MAAEFSWDVLLLKLNCSHSSGKYFWIKIFKPWPSRNLEVFNEDCTDYKTELSPFVTKIWKNTCSWS